MRRDRRRSPAAPDPVAPVSRAARRARALFAGLLMAVPAAAPLAAQVGAEPGAPRIVVTVEGRATAAPDMATLRFGVERDARQAAAALDAMGQAAGALLATLDAAGIAPADRQTGALRLHPVRSEGPERAPGPDGYRAATEVTARVRDLDRLGAVIDAGVAAGANRLQGLRFGLAAPEAAQDTARRAAVAEGRRRAALYAQAAGVTLGPLLLLSETGPARPEPRMMQADLATSAGVPVAEGETVVSVTLRLVYEIAP